MENHNGDFYGCRLAPLGVCSLVASRIAGMDNILGTLEKLTFYMLTVICGLFIHSLITLPLVFFLVTRKNPYSFMKGLRDALMTAFGIASRYEAKISSLIRTHAWRFPRKADVWDVLQPVSSVNPHGSFVGLRIKLKRSEIERLLRSCWIVNTYLRLGQKGCRRLWEGGGGGGGRRGGGRYWHIKKTGMLDLNSNS